MYSTILSRFTSADHVLVNKQSKPNHQLLSGATCHFFDQLDVRFYGAGNGMAEITINTATLFAAQVRASGAHAHELPVFGNAEAFSCTLVGLQFWHDSPLL